MFHTSINKSKLCTISGERTITKQKKGKQLPRDGLRWTILLGMLWDFFSIPCWLLWVCLFVFYLYHESSHRYTLCFDTPHLMIASQLKVNNCGFYRFIQIWKPWKHLGMNEEATCSPSNRGKRPHIYKHEPIAWISLLWFWMFHFFLNLHVFMYLFIHSSGVP